MKKIMMLMFTLLFASAYTFAQVPEGQPEQQEQYQEQEGDLNEEAPEQQPQQLEQEGETTSPGQEEGETEEQEGETEMEESDPMQQEGEASTDRFEDAKTMKYRQLPDPVKNELENGYFSDWEVKEVYAAGEVKGNQEVPADFILKVEKEGEIMNLYYQSNGELLMQEKGELHEHI